MITIYATGCLVGKQLNQMDWLTEAEDHFEYFGVPVMSPLTMVDKELKSLGLTEVPVTLPQSIHWRPKAILDRQVANIKESSAVLVCLDGYGLNLVGTLEVTAAITTARLLEIPVMAFGLPPEHLKQSPWLTESIYSLQLSLDEALETITDFLGLQTSEELPEYL